MSTFNTMAARAADLMASLFNHLSYIPYNGIAVVLVDKVLDGCNHVFALQHLFMPSALIG